MSDHRTIQGMDAARLARIDAHFGRYVDDGRLPGYLALVARRGEIAHLSTYGMRDVEAGLPVEPDTLFRIYSMSKPITSVAAMMLYEEGAFQLRDPISRFIPAFADARVYAGGPASAPLTVPATEPVRVEHLLTHTSGLTYGFHHMDVADELYRRAGFEWATPKGLDLAACCDAWARLPLVAQPGSRWNYGVSTDVLGRVVEVVSGQPLDVFLHERILGPLKMTDTAFAVPEDQQHRLAALYTREPRGTGIARLDRMGAATLRPPRILLGGQGLVSTAADYHRFAQFLLNGGELDGVRLLGSRTVRRMATNHIPGGRDLTQYGRPVFAEVAYEGVGFGLGFSVMLDPVANGTLGSPGEFAWGGAASTAFWVDPAEELTVVFLTQLLPSSTYPIRPQLKQLVYSSIID